MVHSRRGKRSAPLLKRFKRFKRFAPLLKSAPLLKNPKRSAPPPFLFLHLFRDVFGPTCPRLPSSHSRSSSHKLSEVLRSLFTSKPDFGGRACRYSHHFLLWESGCSCCCSLERILLVDISCRRVKRGDALLHMGTTTPHRHSSLTLVDVAIHTRCFGNLCRVTNMFGYRRSVLGLVQEW